MNYPARSPMLLASMVCLAVSACALVKPHGPSETLFVQARQNGTLVSGARCQLINERGRWNVPGSPGSVTIERGTGNLVAVCEKAGLAPGFLTVKTGRPPLPTPGPYSPPPPPPATYALYPSHLTVDLGENRSVPATTP
jgi:hypothetical protein